MMTRPDLIAKINGVSTDMIGRASGRDRWRHFLFRPSVALCHTRYVETCDPLKIMGPSPYGYAEALLGWKKVYFHANIRAEKQRS